MRMIISPAKKMRTDPDGLAAVGLPRFRDKAERVKQALQRLTAEELQALWRCSDSLARLNAERLRGLDLERGLTPAVLAYEGIQYRYMAPGVFERGEYAFLQEHLRILSGFYGVLRPLDGVVPYRLEMQAKLSVDGCRDLYDFWGGRLAGELAAETDLILNLASREYSRAVTPYLPRTVRVVTCVFGERSKGKIVERGTLCKMARGQMVRWLTERQVTKAVDVRDFDGLGYAYDAEYSTPDELVFLRKEPFASRHGFVAVLGKQPQGGQQDALPGVEHRIDSPSSG